MQHIKLNVRQLAFSFPHKRRYRNMLRMILPAQVVKLIWHFVSFEGNLKIYRHCFIPWARGHIGGVVIFVNFIVYIFLFLSFYSLYFDIYYFVILTRFVTDKLEKNLAPKNLAYIFDNNCHYPKYLLDFFLESIFSTLIVISPYLLLHFVCFWHKISLFC